MTTISAVVLTQGDRPAELAAAIASIQAQEADVEVVVVANGVPPDDIPGATVVELPENVGIPAGRNVGWRATTGDLVLFLDDDAALVGTSLLTAAALKFANDDRLGIVSLAIEDDDGGVLRRHVPRLIVGDPRRSSDVTTFLGGACIIRRAVLDQTGGFPDHFFYAHEETDLAWAALDARYRIHYAGDLTVRHPSTPISRHTDGLHHTARNRVFLARRRLPWILAGLYLPIRMLMSLSLVRSLSDLRALARGYRAGFTQPAGQRNPISWLTAWTMTRLGRPPVI